MSDLAEPRKMSRDVEDTAEACRLARLEGIQMGAREVRVHVFDFWPPCIPSRHEGADQRQIAMIEGVREGIQRISDFAVALEKDPQ